MSKAKTKKAARKAANLIKSLPKPTQEQIADIYQEFQQYTHMP
ncbi:hypothetical protein [Allocoleopsis sp.]